MASGIPSRRRQISTTAAASPTPPTVKRGETCCARSMNKATAAGVDAAPTSSEGTGHSRSSAMPSLRGGDQIGGRRGRQDGLDQIGGGVQHVFAVVEHQQPLPALQGGGHSLGHAAPGLWVTPSTAATASGTAAASLTAASSKNHTPSGNSSTSRPATSSASRVLPTPPTPVSVTSR